jgi:nickel-dependent lactate racemase
MDIPLHCVNRTIPFQVPPENVAGFIQPQAIKSSGSNIEIVKEAVNRIESQLDRQLDGRSVGVLLPDGTRDLPLQDILKVLLPLLKSARTILFFICTGSHRPQTPANEQIISCLHTETTRAGIRAYEIISHDCQKGPFRSMGRTTRGSEIRYNARLEEVDVVVILSDVKHHYFAGYSNPVKNIFPGLCAFNAIEQNHSMTFDESSQAGVHPWHADPNKRDNPLAADQCEAFERIVRDRPVWALTTISNARIIQWADFEYAADASARAFDQVDKWNARTVEKVEYLVVSPGGLPNDVDLYIAQRALELTASTVQDGGQVLFMAACPEGIGSELTRKHFEDKLKRPPEEILNQSPGKYHLFEHKPYRFAKLIQRLHRLWVHSEMDASVIRDIYMHPCMDPKATVSQWLTQDPDARILFIDKANKLLVRPISCMYE